MSGQWAPGDVAMVTADWSNGVTQREAAVKVLGGWQSLVSGVRVRHGDTITARPLVLLDPADREQVERLADLMAWALHSDDTPRLQAALREYAAPKPPRLDEPAAWGVVEASCVHSKTRRNWTRDEDGNWWVCGPYAATGREPLNPDDWDSLIDPVLVRAGVLNEAAGGTE